MPSSDQKINHAEQGTIRPMMENDDSNPMKYFDSEKVEAYDQTGNSFESISEDKSSIHSAPPIRGLSARHIQMLSLGGCIGTGLFLNSGQNIAIVNFQILYSKKKKK